MFNDFVDSEETPQPVKTFKAPETATDVLVRALTDAEILIGTSGPTSAVDRVHTALHAYLIDACKEKKISHTKDPSISELFKVLREQHPALQKLGNSNEELKTKLRSMSAILDAINTLRNRASVAHPTNKLLTEDESMFAINTVRSMLHYLDARLSP